MISMIREQESRKEQALIILDRLLATGMPEEQAHALIFGADEAIDEDCPEIDPGKTPGLWADMMKARPWRSAIERWPGAWPDPPSP